MVVPARADLDGLKQAFGLGRTASKQLGVSSRTLDRGLGDTRRSGRPFENGDICDSRQAQRGTADAAYPCLRIGRPSGTSAPYDWSPLERPEIRADDRVTFPRRYCPSGGLNRVDGAIRLDGPARPDDRRLRRGEQGVASPTRVRPVGTVPMRVRLGARLAIALSCVAFAGLESGCSSSPQPGGTSGASEAGRTDKQPSPGQPAAQGPLDKTQFIARAEQACARARGQLQERLSSTSADNAGTLVADVTRILRERTGDVRALPAPEQDQALLDKNIADAETGLDPALSDGEQAQLRARLYRRARSYGFDRCWRELEDVRNGVGGEKGPRELDARSVAEARRRVAQIAAADPCDRIDVRLASDVLGVPPEDVRCSSSVESDPRYPPMVRISYYRPQGNDERSEPGIRAHLMPLATTSWVIPIEFYNRQRNSHSPPVPGAQTTVVWPDNTGDGGVEAAIQRTEGQGVLSEAAAGATLADGQVPEDAANKLFELMKALDLRLHDKN